MNVQSWGRITNLPHHTQDLTNRLAAGVQIKGSKNTIAYGMGRSYGDACLNPNGGIWLTKSLDKYISFDEENGILECESGVLLRDIQRLFVPKGWMLPVSPGTQMITIGGAIANDVHGKNHHVFGSFADSLTNIQIQRTTGEIIDCGPNHQQDWFAATVGGIGLTGLILKASIRLRPVQSPWLNTETIAYETLEEFFQLADTSELNWEHTVSWIDCLSTSNITNKRSNKTKARGLFMRGNHALLNDREWPKEKNKKFPFTPPFSLVNNLSLQLFNSAYFAKGKYKAGATMEFYEKFFYPLDDIQEWNRMYGPMGFYQYQCVIPREHGVDAVRELLNQISKSKSGSFLAVLKTFGNRSSLGMLSFPMPGVTLALDFPNHNEVTLQLLNRLDAVVKQVSGRIYLAKDARMSKEMFEQGYSKHQEFLTFRDPGISSLMSKRLMGF